MERDQITLGHKSTEAYEEEQNKFRQILRRAGVGNLGEINNTEETSVDKSHVRI